jgi:hypothetical protein
MPLLGWGEPSARPTPAFVVAVTSSPDETGTRAGTMGRMSRRGKRTTAVAVLVAACALAACTGGSDEAEPGADAPIETDAPAATEAVTELERTQQVNEFLEAVEFNANCTSSECSTAQAMYSRYQNLYELAGEIPGDDILPYLTVISSAWDAWNDCLSTAETRFERFDCAEESDMRQAINDLYNALR